MTAPLTPDEVNDILGAPTGIHFYTDLDATEAIAHLMRAEALAKIALNEWLKARKK
jgi:hypothetical protein